MMKFIALSLMVLADVAKAHTNYSSIGITDVNLTTIVCTVVNTTVNATNTTTDYTPQIQADLQQYFCFIYNLLEGAGEDFSHLLTILQQFKLGLGLDYGDIHDITENYGEVEHSNCTAGDITIILENYNDTINAGLKAIFHTSLADDLGDGAARLFSTLLASPKVAKAIIQNGDEFEAATGVDVTYDYPGFEALFDSICLNVTAYGFFRTEVLEDSA
eukprot:775270_1